MGIASRLHLGRRQLGIVRPDGQAARRDTVAFGYCFGTLHPEFVASLIALREHELARMGRGEHVYVRHQIPQAGLYIDHNRNRVVEKFMTTSADWLLQVDTDVEFPPDLPAKMLELCGSERKILAASVPLGPPLPSCGWMMTESPGIWQGVPSAEITAEGIEVDGIATAVCIVHREVFEAIADQVGQMWFFKTLQPRWTSEKSRAAWAPDGRVRDREYVSVGEDLAFSMRAHDAGYKLHVAKIPGLRHHKRMPLSHDFEAELPPQAPAAEEPMEVRG